MPQNVVVLYHPHRHQAKEEAEWLAAELRKRGVQVEIGNGWQRNVVEQLCCDRDLIITLGGDGTIIRIAALAARIGVPMLGVNLGRVGFLADMTPENLRGRVDDLAEGNYWVEIRAMLDIHGKIAGKDFDAIALNEVAVARGPIPRAIDVQTRLNGTEFMTYSADGMLVATATGSTAYSLAAGGPILYPEATDFLLTPVAPHLHIGRSMVLPADTVVSLTLLSDRPAVVSVDGADGHDLHPQDSIDVQRSNFVAKFAHLRPSDYFYRAIAERLT